MVPEGYAKSVFDIWGGDARSVISCSSQSVPSQRSRMLNKIEDLNLSACLASMSSGFLMSRASATCLHYKSVAADYSKPITVYWASDAIASAVFNLSARAHLDDLLLFIKNSATKGWLGAARGYLLEELCHAVRRRGGIAVRRRLLK